MMAITHRGLGHLRDKSVGITQQNTQHRPGTIKFFHQYLCLEAITVAAWLHHGTTGRGVAAHKKRNSQYAFVANTGYFRRATVFEQVVQRNDGGGWLSLIHI